MSGSSPLRWAYFDGRQTHFRVCNSLVATRSAQGLCITRLRQESRPSITLCASAAACSGNTRPTILEKIENPPAQVHVGGVRPVLDSLVPSTDKGETSCIR